MKRIWCIFTALLFLGASAIADDAKMEGDWELISIGMDGILYEDLAQQGISMTMRLEADGTGVQIVNDESHPCTWMEAILITNSDGSISYVLQPDGTLRGEDQAGDSMTFARAAPSSVAGAWSLTAAETEGITITDISTLDIELDLLLNAEGTGTLFSGESKASCTWTQSGTAVTVVEANGGLLDFTLRQDGALAWVIDDITLILRRTDDATPPPEATDPAAVVSEYGFSVQLPEGWVAIDSAYIAQITASVGEELASASGFDQSLLDQLAAAQTSLYYASDMSANFNVVREPAGDVTMDNFASLESSYREILSTSQGIADFALSGPVDINGNSYYVGTFTAQAGLE